VKFEDVWVAVRSNLTNHPKLSRLSDLLKTNKIKALGHLVCLWLYAQKYRADGDLTGWDDHLVASAAEWKGNASRFVSALLEAGFLDDVEGQRLIHDWEGHGGRLRELWESTKEATKVRQQLHRDKKRIPILRANGNRCAYCGRQLEDREFQIDHVVPIKRGGRNEPENVVPCCPPCNYSKSNRTPDEAGMKVTRCQPSNEPYVRDAVTQNPPDNAIPVHLNLGLSVSEQDGGAGEGFQDHGTSRGQPLNQFPDWVFAVEEYLAKNPDERPHRRDVMDKFNLLRDFLKVSLADVRLLIADNQRRPGNRFKFYEVFKTGAAANGSPPPPPKIGGLSTSTLLAIANADRIAGTEQERIAEVLRRYPPEAKS